MRHPDRQSPDAVLSQPLSEEFLKRLIAAGESDLVEFKREWWDLSQAHGKALFVKSVLALANTVRPDAPAFVLIGVEDERRGAGVVGIKDPPEPETVSNIIANYIHPPATVHCRHFTLEGMTVSAITVVWNPARPHHSLRQHEGILSTNVVYVRRDRTVGTLTLPEIEVMVREKDARLGPLIAQDPIQFGFVQKAQSSVGNALVARVTNVTTEPIGGVDVMIDVRNTRNPELCFRARRLGNATLQPGQSREVELRLSEVDFYLATFDPKTGARSWATVRELGSHVGDRWLDVTLHVDYRGRDGFIRHMEQRVALDA